MTVASVRIRPKRVLPGFALSLGTTLLYVSVIILIPIIALVISGAGIGWDRFVRILTSARTLDALRVTVMAAAIATVINAFYGLLMAWVLTRYEFRGRAFLDAMMDIPFALPTAVAGLALTSLFASTGWFGGPLEAMGIQVVYALPGIIIAMTFTSVPFVVRAVQPVLEDLDPALEEAAKTLGATPWQTFSKVILPAILPAWLGGCTVSMARSMGEFGAVVFIAGNLPGKTEIASLLAFIRLQEYDYRGASVIALILLVFALLLLLISNLFQIRAARYREGGK
ncbi:sulfate ABC transporter permease subunit CysT [Pseudomonas sp. GX19020]|uniref:sulfate ABC transporter permease subunit CysT n=1 Tax=Pseudomonadota TaxID=1224 RepID=UPI00089897AD|nr:MULTISPECIES: sulfate ABC transporter permease subunit CysT [Pseudomonadota]MCL4068459.1 sulfate ABC transporter permease subunit CysT [Pseudomonas sp. GX19020]SED19795.1 sulfate transport system permease protein [Rhodobacter sp. 24-YEA-8]